MHTSHSKQSQNKLKMKQMQTWSFPSRNLLAIITIALMSISLISVNAQNKTIVHCGYLIDGIDNSIQEERSILVEGNKIVGVEKGYIEAKEGEQVIDLKDAYILPGLIDMHVHLESEFTSASYLERFTNDKADLAFQAVSNAQKTLEAGFTTVRDLGGTGVNTALRDAINKGLVDGPRIYSVNKSLAITGGHADPTNGYGEHVMCAMPGPESGVCDGTEECMKAVRQQVKLGADWIKITATAGVLSVAKDGDGPQFTEEEITAIVKTAKDRGVNVAAHAHGIEGMQRAIRAGVKTIEHGSYMDSETMELMKKHNTYLVATITAGRSVADSAKIEGYFPDIITPKALAVGPQIQGTFGKAYKAGVPIAFGTDAGVFPHGKNALEFQYMIEEGMPEMEAIQIATIVNARILEADDQIGSIEVNKLADLIACTKNPLEDISELSDIVFVMKNGKVYKNTINTRQ